jgi:pyruvate/2-oxoglutarate dehydrogenase complex dihydrolipoamide acyltransferase (E2) component
LRAAHRRQTVSIFANHQQPGPHGRIIKADVENARPVPPPFRAGCTVHICRTCCWRHHRYRPAAPAAGHQDGTEGRTFKEVKLDGMRKIIASRLKPNVKSRITCAATRTDAPAEIPQPAEQNAGTARREAVGQRLTNKACALACAKSSGQMQFGPVIVYCK